jgi:Competence protein CoiA-like family
MPRATQTVLLAWARDRDGRRVHVSALDPARRRDRAPFSCPGCREELVPHLGRVRARHFAHRPGSTCPLAAPETALHWNAKERLLELCEDAFAGRRRVRLSLRCPACRRPAPVDLAALGDAASTEGRLGSLRADVLVTRGGTPSLALEVRVAHALEAAKEEALFALGVPAVEVDAREEWERGEEGGIAVACERSAGFPRCAACEASARAEEGRALGGEEAAVAELESYRARGLMGPPPGRPLALVPPLGAAERAGLARAFRCPSCGGRGLAFGERLAAHACPGGAPRAAAWRGYDGRLVELSWWRA